MTVEEAVRTLGKCIQADPRYQQYQQAKQNNDADTALQEQIGACLGCVCQSTETDAHSHVHNKRVCKDGPVFRSTEVEL